MVLLVECEGDDCASDIGAGAEDRSLGLDCERARDCDAANGDPASLAGTGSRAGVLELLRNEARLIDDASEAVDEVEDSEAAVGCVRGCDFEREVDEREDSRDSDEEDRRGAAVAGAEERIEERRGVAGREPLLGDERPDCVGDASDEVDSD